jgi:hypothetical protein
MVRVKRVEMCGDEGMAHLKCARKSGHESYHQKTVAGDRHRWSYRKDGARVAWRIAIEQRRLRVTT